MRFGTSMTIAKTTWLAVLSGVAASLAIADPAPARRFEVRDSVEMSYFGTVFNSQPGDLDDDGITSPDGRYFVKVTHRGVLPEGVTEGTIWLFDTTEVRRSVNDPSAGAPTPVPIARMSAAVNGEEFSAARSSTVYKLAWADDSSSLTFLGRDRRENRQIFRVDIATRLAKALTPPSQDVVDYVRAREVIAYLAAPDVHEEQTWLSAGSDIPDIVEGTGRSLLQLLYPHQRYEDWVLPRQLEVWRVRGDSAEPIVDPTTNAPVRVVTRYATETLGISADGNRLATLIYATPPVGAVSRDELATLDRGLRYALIDLDSGTSKLVLDARIVDVNFDGVSTGRYRAAWSPNGTELAVTNVKPPVRLSAGHPADPQTCSVTVVTLATRNSKCVTVRSDAPNAFLYALQWNASGTEITVRYRRDDANDYTEKQLRRNGTNWATVGRLESAARAFQLTIREAPNEPPVLVALDPSTGKSRVIFDPNPQLGNISLGSVSAYEFADPHGRTIRAGLVKPPGYDPGRRYPLVIQTHGFNSHRFYTVGGSQTSNAGRPLAGRNLLVLQVREPYEPFGGTLQEGTENGAKVYLAAIDRLSADGLIDPKRVGITGYSASGFLVVTAITRAPDRFAAAVVSNTSPGALNDFHNFVDYCCASYVQGYVTGVGGAEPFGEGLQKWIENAPGLSPDRIRAPVLVSASDPFHLISLWPLYASLRYLGRPVDLLYIRDGAHNIVKPLQVLAHQEALVDWFDFWLNDHEDQSSDKAAQYLRWRALRQARAATK